jgi:hypothetical protein
LTNLTGLRKSTNDSFIVHGSVLSPALMPELFFSPILASVIFGHIGKFFVGKQLLFTWLMEYTDRHTCVFSSYEQPMQRSPVGSLNVAAQKVDESQFIIVELEKSKRQMSEQISAMQNVVSNLSVQRKENPTHESYLILKGF